MGNGCCKEQDDVFPPPGPSTEKDWRRTTLLCSEDLDHLVQRQHGSTRTGVASNNTIGTDGVSWRRGPGFREIQQMLSTGGALRHSRLAVGFTRVPILAIQCTHPCSRKPGCRVSRARPREHDLEAKLCEGSPNDSNKQRTQQCPILLHAFLTVIPSWKVKMKRKRSNPPVQPAPSVWSLYMRRAVHTPLPANTLSTIGAFGSTS